MGCQGCGMDQHRGAQHFDFLPRAEPISSSVTCAARGWGGQGEPGTALSITAWGAAPCRQVGWGNRGSASIPAAASVTASPALLGATVPGAWRASPVPSGLGALVPVPVAPHVACGCSDLGMGKALGRFSCPRGHRAKRCTGGGGHPVAPGLLARDGDRTAHGHVPVAWHPMSTPGSVQGGAAAP